MHSVKKKISHLKNISWKRNVIRYQIQSSWFHEICANNTFTVNSWNFRSNAHYVPTAATTMQYHKEPPFARFTYEPDGTVQVVQDLRCISCQGPLTQNNWRRDGGSIPQCDSCANYTKMNGIRGLPSSNSTKSSSGASRRVSTTSSSSKVGIPQYENLQIFCHPDFTWNQWF